MEGKKSLTKYEVFTVVLSVVSIIVSLFVLSKSMDLERTRNHIKADTLLDKSREMIGLRVRSRYESEERFYSAMNLVRDAESLRPGYVRVFVARAMVEWGRGNKEEAARSFREALRVDHDSYQSLIGLGLLAGDAGKRDEKIMWLEKAANADPSISKAYTLLGNLYQMEGNHEIAKEKYSKAVSVDPSDSSAMTGLGFVEMKLGNFAVGMARMLEAIKIDPDDPIANLNIAETYMSSSMLEDAYPYIVRATSGDYSSPQTVEKMLVCAAACKKFEEGERFVKESLERFPGSLSVHYAVIAFHEARSNKKAAEAVKRRMELIGPSLTDDIDIFSYNQLSTPF